VREARVDPRLVEKHGHVLGALRDLVEEPLDDDQLLEAALAGDRASQISAIHRSRAARGGVPTETRLRCGRHPPSHFHDLGFLLPDDLVDLLIALSIAAGPSEALLLVVLGDVAPLMYSLSSSFESRRKLRMATRESSPMR